MKITLGTKDLEKIVKDYAHTNYPGKDIQVAITNKRNGVEVVIDLEEPEVCETEDSCEQVRHIPVEVEVDENIDENQEEGSNF
jgi:adenosine/AMP kinase